MQGDFHEILLLHQSHLKHYLGFTEKVSDFDIYLYSFR